jgi:SET domain-containing protein
MIEVPNLGLQGQIFYVALRDITADEELTFD